MKKWEEIIKDNLKEYESALPEGSFADFRARRSGTAEVSEARRFPLVWVIAPVLAAGFAAVLLLHQPSSQKGSVQVVSQPSEAPASMVSAAEIAEDDAVALSSAAEVPSTKDVAEVAPAAPAALETPSTKSAAAEAVVQGAESTETAVPAEAAPLYQSSPYIPQERSAKPVRVKVAPVAGAVAGGGLLAALLTPSVLRINDIRLPQKFRYLSSSGGDLTESVQQSDPYQYHDITPVTEEKVDVLTGQRFHNIPFRTGVSFRMPLTERLNLTTGLEYSRYVSKFRFTLSGEKTQIARYIGVPVRLDWTLASNRWLDVYLGGGLEGDYCVGATLEGEKLPKEGFGMSALAASGLQLNLTDRLGLYVEPELTYTFSSKSRIYETYRSQKPLFFSVSSGLRIRIGN